MVSRRAFLGGCAAGSMLSLGLTSGSPAADPPRRTGRSHMKLSLAAYSFNRQLPKAWTAETRDKGELTLEGFIDYCAELDLDGTELTSYYFPKEVTPGYLLSLKERCFRLGLSISGTAIGNDFCLPDGPARDEQLALCRRWIDYAAMLGAPAIRIFAGKTPKGDSEEAARDRCVAGINECLNYAAEKGVCLALENHGGITATPAQLLAIVKAVRPSPWFGINYDSGNFQTDDPYADLEQIAPYAINAQIKVAVVSKGKKEPADIPRMVQILKAAAYRGFVVLEYEEADPRKEIPGYIRQLRELITA